MAIINAELELLKLKIQHPEPFDLETLPTFESSLSVIPKFQYLGIMGMTEILSALMLLGGIVDNAGKKPSIIAISEPYNLTKTLDALKAALIKEYKKRQAEALKNKDEKR